MALKYLCAVVCAASLMIPMTPGWAQSGEKTAEDPVVVRVNGAEIHRSDVIAAQHALPAQYRSIPLSAIYPALLKQMIATMLSVQAARVSGLDKEPVVVQRIKSFEARILEDAFIGRILAQRVTDDALRARHEKSSKTTGEEEQVRARHILVKTKAEADQIIKEIANGADFEDMARKKSTGPSGAKGGDLGFFTRGAMVKPFSEAAFALKAGQVTPNPVQTRFGFHVIKLVERRKSAAPTFAEARDKLHAEMSKEVVQEIVAGLRANAKIEQFNIDGSPLIPAGIRPIQGGARPVP
jgi:peptidyl-prolyl cis-trans isomerase C